MAIALKRVLAALKPWQAELPLSAFHARFMAQTLGAKLRLMSCVYDTEVAIRAAKADGGAIAAQAGLVEGERTVLKELARSFHDWGIDAELAVRWGHPVEDVILDEIRSWRADLLVVGTRHAGIKPHNRISRIDWHLMRSCPCPMLLARDPMFAGYETVLAAIDPLHRHAHPEGLDRSILATAAYIAKAAQSRLLVGHVHPDPSLYSLASAVEVLPGVYYDVEHVADAHRQAVAELAAEYGVKPGDIVLESGDPSEKLSGIITRHDVDLIVMGALKRTGLRDWLLGSTTERIVTDAECDVLLIKPEG